MTGNSTSDKLSGDVQLSTVNREMYAAHPLDIANLMSGSDGNWDTSVFSINAPVPGRVRELAASYYPSLRSFERIREDHSIMVKRLGESEEVSQLQRRVHRTLEATPAVQAEITGLGYFDDPPLGPSPVVYLAVDSPGLEQIHADLVETFGAVTGLEGEDYVPHVTLARGGDVESARAFVDREISPIRFTVTELEFVDGTYRLPVSRISLPS